MKEDIISLNKINKKATNYMNKSHVPKEEKEESWRYRFSCNMPSQVATYIDPTLTGYMLLRQPKDIGDSTWNYVRPSLKELPTSVAFVDPNDQNKEYGLPPSYGIFPINNFDKPYEWILEHFDNVVFTKEVGTDYIFEGDFKGYGDESKLPEQAKA